MASKARSAFAAQLDEQMPPILPEQPIAQPISTPNPSTLPPNTPPMSSDEVSSQASPDAAASSSAVTLNSAMTTDSFYSDSYAAFADAVLQAKGPADSPSLAVAVYNRLAYGPRAGDLDAFNALGSTDVERLTRWVDQQLNPSTIDDSDCTNRLTQHALPAYVTAGLSFDSTYGIVDVNTPTVTTVDPATLTQKIFIAGVKGSAVTTPPPANGFANTLLSHHWTNYRRKPNRGEQFTEWRPFRDVRISTILRTTYSKRQLYETLVEFWHNHFSVNALEGYAVVTWIYQDTCVIRKNTLGNFRQFLEDVAKSPAMLYYLDNYLNTVAGPNENWARELFELHGLGAENYYGVKTSSEVPGYPVAPQFYVDEDVYEAARCFTGWQVDDNNGSDNDPTTWGKGTFLYVTADHDRFKKEVLGQRLAQDQAAEKDGKDVLDLIANHPGTARFIARKLCRRLIGDAVTEPTVQAAADVFYNNRSAPDQIKKTVRAVLLSDEFRTTYGQKIKRPWEITIGALRASGAQLNLKPVLKTDSNGKKSWDDEDDIYYYYEPMGMPMFGRRPPDGWPDVKGAWNGTTSMLMRWKFINWMIAVGEDGNKGTRTDVKIDLLTPTNAGVVSKTAASIVDFWCNRILGRLPAASTRDELISFLGAGNLTQPLNFNDDNTKKRLRLLVGLILCSPEFNWR